MLAPQGHWSILRLYRDLTASFTQTARSVLAERIDEHADVSQDRIDVAQFECIRAARFAARLVIFDYANRHADRFNLFVGPLPNPMRLSPFLLAPNFSLSPGLQEHLPDTLHGGVTGWDTLKLHTDRVWREMFRAVAASDGVPGFEMHRFTANSSNPLRQVSCINYDTGSIDLTGLRAIQDIGKAHLNLAACSDSSGIVEAPAVFYSGGYERASGYLNTLAPYDGAPVLILDTAAGAVLSDFGIESEREYTAVEATEPWERILEALDADRSLTKDEVKARVCPDMSNQKFEYQWKRAAEENPGITKAGRKPSSRKSL